MKNPFGRRSEMGIRKRVFFLLLVVFVPLLLLQGFTFYKWYLESREDELEANLELARTVSETFEHFIREVLHTQLTIGMAATASPPPSADSLRRILQVAEDLHPMLRSFSWINPEGVTLVATNTSIEKQKIRGQTIYPRISGGEEYRVTDVYYSSYTGEKVFAIGRGIRNPQGDLLGIVSCICVVDKLDSLLAVQRAKDAGIGLIDSQGTHVFRYPPRKYTPEQTNWIKRFPRIRDALEGKEVIAEVNGLGGERRLAAYAPVPFIRWVASASRAKDHVISSILDTLLPQVGLLLIVTLAASGAAVRLSRPVVESILKLKNHASALGRGKMDNIALDTGPVELKHLADTLNEMADSIKKSDQALRQSRDELDLRVQERTAELERKNQELQEFAFVASHDLREPLRKIQTFGSLLEAKGSAHLNDLEKEYIFRMNGAASRMEELLNSLLHYSRIDLKGQEFRPTGLNDAVKEVLTNLEAAIRDSGAQIEIGALPTVKGDRHLLQQLFQNLFSNALKYCRLEVKTVLKVYGEENDGTARVFVEDNGIGFDEKYLDKIFQPYQRLHGKHEYSGTGIGLAICKKIVERHRGTITARSIPGKGSTFMIALPTR